MFEEFIKNQYVISLLNQYKEKDWLRVSYAIYIYGAKHFQEKYPNIISDLNAIERIVYKSPKEFNNDTISERKKLAMTKFFEGIKNKKGNKPEELSPEQTNKQLKKNKENAVLHNMDDVTYFLKQKKYLIVELTISYNSWTTRTIENANTSDGRGPK